MSRAYLRPKDACPDETRYHTHDPQEPAGYIGWHEWAERKARTHYQRRCPTCGLFAVYVKRGKPLTDEKIHHLFGTQESE